MKKSAKVEHGFKVTSDGRLIIREDDEEDVKEKGKWNPVVGLVRCFMSEQAVTITHHFPHRRRRDERYPGRGRSHECEYLHVGHSNYVAFLLL